MTKPTILIVSTSAARMTSGEPTGIWLEELTTPFYAFLDAGADVTVASIEGGEIPVDPRSEADEAPSARRARLDKDFQKIIADTPRFDSLTKRFDAVFLPGGHGVMFDFPGSQALADLVSRQLAEGRVIAAVCHGPAGLVAARGADGAPVVQGRKVAGFTNSEEGAVELDTAVPFLLQTRLEELGADYRKGPDFQSFAVRDGDLITGQNPQSAGEVARLVLDAVGARQAA